MNDMRKLHLVDFIQHNKDWETILKQAPYGLYIKHSGDLCLFKYSKEGMSDFSLPLVRECRGIILDMKTLTPVSMSFEKFGNYTESYVPQIDWRSVKVQDKLDGSLMRLYYYKGAWRVSTMGVINANEAAVICAHKYANDDEEISTLNFEDLFWEGFKNVNGDLSKLNPKYNYTFELVSPYNRQVIKYAKTELWHIGTRNMEDLSEIDMDIGIQKPQEFPLNSQDACIAAAEKYQGEKEGFVVVDKDWNRIKIKSSFYVLQHHVVNNNVSLKQLVHLFVTGESIEFLGYFPEYHQRFDDLRVLQNTIIEKMETEYLKFARFEGDSDIQYLVPKIQQNKWSAFIFKRIRGHVKSAQDFINTWPKYEKYLYQLACEEEIQQATNN